MKINKKGLLFTLLWMCITLIEYFYVNNLCDYQEILSKIALLSLINIFIKILIWNLSDNSLKSPFMIFIYCAYLFHFGQVIMTGLLPNVEFSYLNYVTTYMTNEYIAEKTFKISIICLNMIYLGGLLKSNIKNIRLKYKKSELANKTSQRDLYNIAKILLVFSTPFRLYIDIRTFFAAVIGGYYGAIAVSYSGIIDCFASFWYPAIVLFYLGLKNSSKKKKFVAVVCLYLGIVMLTGNRGHQIVCLLTLFITIIIERNKKITIKNLVLYFVMIYFGLIFIDIIYSMRETGIGYFFSNFKLILVDSLKGNIFFETIGSFGETIFTPYLTINAIDNGFVNPNFAECFYKSILSVFPISNDYLLQIIKQANFVKMLGTKFAIGGSIVGEMYYNFRDFYWIFSILVGYYLQNVSNKIIDGIEKKNYDKVLYSIPIFSNLLWWSRDSISNAIRGIVWICIFIWILKKFIRSKEK